LAPKIDPLRSAILCLQEGLESYHFEQDMLFLVSLNPKFSSQALEEAKATKVLSSLRIKTIFLSFRLDKESL